MFDSHAHYDHKRFDFGREELLEKMHEEGLEYCLNAAIGFESNEKMMKLLGKYPWVFFAVGIHPNAVEEDEENDEIYQEKLNLLTEHKQVRAIGETGLDYYRLEQVENIEQMKARQKKWFQISLKLAKEKNLPVVLHIRGDADKDALKILDTYGYEGMQGVVHCFTGGYDLAMEYIKRGFLIGIGGMITRDEMEELREAVKKLPMEKILLETDSPYVRPQGMAGKRNTSESLRVIVKKIAELTSMSESEIEKVTDENSKNMFKVLSDEKMC